VWACGQKCHTLKSSFSRPISGQIKSTAQPRISVRGKARQAPVPTVRKTLPEEVTVSSTKLVELRNRLSGKTQSAPLFVFVPTGIRTAAEDSFGVATFEEVTLGDVYGDLKAILIDELPLAVRGAVAAALHRLTDSENSWVFADPTSIIRFLLNAKKNGNTPAAIGMALYELSLVPDHELLAHPEKTLARIDRNQECVTKLTWSAKSARGRVLDLGLSNRAFCARFGNFLDRTYSDRPQFWTRPIALDPDCTAFAFDLWDFTDGSAEPDSIFINSVKTDIPEFHENTAEEAKENVNREVGENMDEEVTQELIPDGVVTTKDHETKDKTAKARYPKQLIGQRVLSLRNKDGPPKFNAIFNVAPFPHKVEGLAKFTVQVISKEHGPIGLVCNKSAWKTNRFAAKVNFRRLGKVEWEEGWHFLRVLAYTKNGDLIPLVDATGALLPWADDEENHRESNRVNPRGTDRTTDRATDPNREETVSPPDYSPGFRPNSRPNESSLFYVLPDGEIDTDIAPQTFPQESSLLQARARFRFAALKSDPTPTGTPTATVAATSTVTWVKQASAKSSATDSDLLEVKFGRSRSVHVAVSRPLKLLEEKILSAPDQPVSWRLPIVQGHTTQVVAKVAPWPEGPHIQRFLAARSSYFAAVQAGTKQLVSQAADFCMLQPLITEYAGAFAQLVEAQLQHVSSTSGQNARRAPADLRRLLSVDTVTLLLRDHRARTREAILLAPTHPLRALWFAAWDRLSAQWITAAQSSPKEFVRPVEDALFHLLTPVGFPPVLPTATGRLCSTASSIHPFWTLYAPSSAPVPRSLVSDVCSALGLPEPAIGGTCIDSAYLAVRVQRYLLQHPYVTTLVINAFNTGRATILASILLHLQKQPDFAHIHYDIRLFTSDIDTPGTGDALIELLSPATDPVSKEAAAFSAPSHRQQPKLALAIRPTAAFHRDPTAHPAHLCLLFDIFPTEEVGTTHASHQATTASIHGLLQNFHVDYIADETAAVWTRQPTHGLALPLTEAQPVTDLLSTLPQTLSAAIATASTGETGPDLRPAITLTLKAEDRAILHQVHEVSDWVFTIDRNMGIEFFDHGGHSGRADYLIDHAPHATGGLGHRLVITSRSLAELESILRPVLEEYCLQTDTPHVMAILEQLRSLSGRLALKLISAPSQRAEALGLALSRMYLEHQGVFQNQLVVPLDTHVALYHAIEKNTNSLEDEVSFRRTDLALFDLNLEARLITCRLVEVKCHRLATVTGAFKQLKREIAQQIAQSQAVLRYHFDTGRFPVDRPDRLVKTLEFATLLEFYLNRAIRYRTISEKAAEEARGFFRTLEQGYRLNFTRTALIFDFEKPGTEAPKTENGIEYHRIGIDLIQHLVAAAVPEESRAQPPTKEAPPSSINNTREAQQSTAQQPKPREKHTSLVPTLESAAFLGQPRNHSSSPADPHAQHTPGAKYLGEQTLGYTPRTGTPNTAPFDPTPFDPTPDTAPFDPTPDTAPFDPTPDTAPFDPTPDTAPFDPTPGTGPFARDSAPGNTNSGDTTTQDPNKEDGNVFTTFASEAEAILSTVPQADKEVRVDSAKTGHARTTRATQEKSTTRDLAAEAQTNETNTAKNGQKTRRAQHAAETHLASHILLGARKMSPQHGMLGTCSGQKVSLDLHQTHTISLFGAQGSGKSYTLGAITEIASLSIPHLNELPNPLSTIIFHYSSTMEYKPEFTSMSMPNSDEAQVRILREQYGAEPVALSDIALLVPARKLDERRAEYPDAEVFALKFAAAELHASHWRFLMGAIGNQSTYIRQINRIMKSLNDNLTLAGLREGIEHSLFSDRIKDMAHLRLDFAAEYIDDNIRLKHIVRPGRLVIVDLRDEFIEKDQALGLFAVLLQLFADAKYEGKTCNKLVVFDEAHKYIDSPDLLAGLIEVVREMRHKGTSILLASQDPLSVPVSLIELSSQIILHKFNSPSWLKHIQKANAALRCLTPENMTHLQPGEAYLWSDKATDNRFSKGAVKIQCRPRLTQHGATTKTTVN